MLNRMPAFTSNQQQAIDKLEKYKVGALFMRPGTGKTRVAITLANTTNCDFVLWLVPFQTKQNLQKEINKWSFIHPYRIEGIESLSNSDKLFVDLVEQLKSYKRSFIIIDESLKIKNDSAIRTNRVMRLAPLSTYRLILNGTPLSKNLLDLWTQMEFLSPKILNMDYQQFKDTFCHYIKYRYLNSWGKPTKWQEFIKNYENLDFLYKLIEPFVYDADLNINRKKQYIEIPFEIETYLDDYESIKEKFLNSFKDDPDSFIKATQAMQHAYCCEPSKLAAIEPLLSDKTIIFTKFINSKQFILNSYPQANVISYGKGSLGLNLQQYNKVIFFDKTFDYAQRDQAEHRVYRLGQDNNVTYYDLTGNVPLEKTIDHNIEYKSDLLTIMKKLLNKGEKINWQRII